MLKENVNIDILKTEEEKIVKRIDELKKLISEIHEELTELYERLDLE